MKMEHANTVTTPLWYALRDLSRSHSKNPAYRVLSDEGFEVFTPMTRRLFTENGRRVSREVPFMHDLLFVHEVRERLDAAVGRLTNLQYRFARGGYRVPITVPDRNMEYFIRAVASSDEPPLLPSGGDNTGDARQACTCHRRTTRWLRGSSALGTGIETPAVAGRNPDLPYCRGGGQPRSDRDNGIDISGRAVLRSTRTG